MTLHRSLLVGLFLAVGLVQAASAQVTAEAIRDRNLKGADLRNANLDGVDFRGASLAGADLRGAKLHGARGFGDLSGADLRDAHVEGADLSRAQNIATALTRNACYDEATLWPAGFNPKRPPSGQASAIGVSSSGVAPNFGMPQGMR